MRIRLTPRDRSFYDMFTESAKNLLVGSRLLVELFNDGADRAAIADKMRACEHAGDDCVHRIMQRMNQTFVTPFDREDIHRLAGEMDDVMDFMEAAADLVVLYQLEELPKEMIRQVEVLERADEVHDRRHRQRHARRQRTRGDRRRDRVGGVVETVGVVEEEGDAQDDDEPGKLHAQDSLTAIVSTVFATCSKASIACSSWSTTSFSLSTVSAS